MSPTQNLDTYYVYNAAGYPIYVIQPQALVLMATNNNNYSLTQTGVNNLIFSFIYDNLGRLVQKNVPGSAPVYYIYDPYNRPVLMQDGNLRANNQWNYVKYDAKGRAISQGIYTDNTSTHLGGLNGGMQAYVTGLASYSTTNYSTTC